MPTNKISQNINLLVISSFPISWLFAETRKQRVSDCHSPFITIEFILSPGWVKPENGLGRNAEGSGPLNPGAPLPAVGHHTVNSKQTYGTFSPVSRY